MIYTPLSERNKDGVYTPIAKRGEASAPVLGVPQTAPLLPKQKSVLGDPQAIKQGGFGLLAKLTKDVVQGTIRGGANLGQTIMTRGNSTVTPTSGYEEKLYGTDKPFSFTSETAPLLKAVGVEEGTKLSKFLSPAVGGILAATDLIPGGAAGKKALVTALRDTSKVEEASKLLKGAGFSEDIAKNYSDIFAKSTDADEIARGLESAQKLQNTTKKVYTPLSERTASIPESKQLIEAKANYTITKDQYDLEKSAATRLNEYTVKQKGHEMRGVLPEITGKDIKGLKMDTQASVKRNTPANIFAKRGDSFVDEILSEAGIKAGDRDIRDVANDFLEKFKSLKEYKKQVAKDYFELKKNEVALEKFLNKGAKYTDSLVKKAEKEKIVKELISIRTKIKEREDFIKSLPNQKTTEGAQTKRVINDTIQPSGTKIVTTDKALLVKRIKDEARGAKFASKDIKGEVKRRRNLIQSIRDTLGLSDSQMRKALQGKDFRFMRDTEFQDFLKAVDGIATQEGALSSARAQVGGTIFEKELQNVENLQRALKLPTISNMSIGQLNEFDTILSKYETGDSFLSTRKIETIDKTDLVGVRTIREAREKLASKLGISVDDLKNINVGEFDRFKWDTSLAEKNPFYRTMVEGFNGSILEGDARYFEIEKKTDDMMRKVRKGKGLLAKVAPTDEKIFAYLESINKEAIAKTMTKDELEVAEYMRKEFAQALKYEYEMKVLGKSGYEDNYITHIRRGFFEAVKDDGLGKAFVELLDKYKQDEAVLTIMDQKTGNILPLEKFFKFAMQRTGGITPTKNVSKAFLTYMQTFERKRALDKIIPEIMTYVDVLTPTRMTPKGLEMDDTLKNFVTEYLNTKKGRASRMFVKPGGKGDFVLRSVKGLTTILDLGINIPVQLGSNAGVQTGLYTVMGGKRYSTGVKRLATKEGKAFVKQFENYTGKTPFDELLETSKGLPEKLYETMFFLFKDAVVRGNKIHLLGSLTEAELKSGIVSPARLAAFKTEAGRWLPVEGSKSILGATTEGGLAMQYKTWAMPPLRTATKNFGTLVKMLKNKQNPISTREFQELFRVAKVGATISLIAYAVGNDATKPQKDQAFITKVINKTLRDAMSMVSAIDPQTYTSIPRTLTFMTDIMTALSSLIRMEEYSVKGDGYNKGDLKGAQKLEKTLTPALIKGQKQPAPVKATGNEGLTPLLPELPKLPSLPALPKLPRL